MAIQPTGLRHYFSKQALLNGYNRVTASVYEFQKKSQLWSVAVNTVRNTVPISVCSLTLYQLHNSFLNPYYVTTIGCMVYGAYLAKDYFYKDEHKTIDKAISQLNTFSKKTHVEIGDEEKAPFEELLSKDLTLHDCKHLLEDLLYSKTQTLFSWHSITGSHREPFERCLKALNDYIGPLGHVQGDFSSIIKKPFNEVISKLMELKAIRSGILTDSYTNPTDIHPRLKELSKSLLSFNQELLIQQSESTFNTSESLNRSIDKLINLIDTCLETESIFTKISPITHEKISLFQMGKDRQYFTTLKEDLETLKGRPINSVAFKEKRDELQLVLEACHNLLSDTPLSQGQSSLRLALEIQSFPQEDVRDISIFETFETTLISHLDQEEKRTTLLQILKNIDLATNTQFEAAFLDEIAKHQPLAPSSVARRSRRGPPTGAPIAVVPSREWAKANLLTCGVNLEETFRDLLTRNLGSESETE